MKSYSVPVETIHFNPIYKNNERKVYASYKSASYILGLREKFDKIKNETKNNDPYIKNNLNYYIPQSKKLKLNIVYYDEKLIENMDKSDYCAYLQMNILGTFYGCHNPLLFEYICGKIEESDREFILIATGSTFEKINYFIQSNYKIREIYILCNYYENYNYLMQKYPKIKGIYKNYQDLNQKLSQIKETKINENVKSSNLIFFEDYVRIYIKLHYEIIRKYCLYKLLKEVNYDENKFLNLVEKAAPKFLGIAKQLFPNKSEIIEFFKKNVDEKPNVIETVFNKSDTIENFISNYTAESFYYKYMNKFLREGNFDAFRILSSHLSKFIYHCYEYRKKTKMENNAKLYRVMYIKPEDFNIYKKSIGRVICYPSFTSTSIEDNNFYPCKSNNNDVFVKLIIDQNNSKSVISIGDLSVYEHEKEYLFLPFSFFKITNVKIGSGNYYNPHIIYLKAMYSDSSIEDLFIYFFEKYTDNLDPEGIDTFFISEDGKKICLNAIKGADLKAECVIFEKKGNRD